SRKGLCQNGHPTLLDGDGGLGERQVGDRRGPVIVRAPPLDPRGLRWWVRRDADRNRAVLDRARRDRFGARYGDLPGVLPRRLVASLVRASHGRRRRGGEGDENVSVAKTGEVSRCRQRQAVVRERR